MSRQSRLRDYKNEVGPKGESTKKNIEFWSNRAHENSDGHRHRASNGPMDLPDTAESAGRVTKPEPHTREKAKADLNNVGETDYYAKVRRGA